MPDEINYKQYRNDYMKLPPIGNDPQGGVNTGRQTNLGGTPDLSGGIHTPSWDTGRERGSGPFNPIPQPGEPVPENPPMSPGRGFDFGPGMPSHGMDFERDFGMYETKTDLERGSQLPSVHGWTEPPAPETPPVETPPTTLPPVIDRGRWGQPDTPPPDETLPPITTPPPGGDDVTTKGNQALDQYMEYAMGEEDPMVAAERQRLERNNLLRSEQAKREAHERAVRAGYQPGTPQYEQILRNGISDAHNQNIAAENTFLDFQRGRRAERQSELMEIYREGTKADQKAWERFEDIVKFLPSDMAQQQLMRAKLGGADLFQTIQGMYNADGTLKNQYKDLTRAELVKQGITDSVNQMATNPDTGEAWKGTEKEDYIEDFYQENFENILWSSKETAEDRTETEIARKKIDDAIEAGDLTGLGPDEWKLVTASQKDKMRENGQILDWNSLDVKDVWDFKGKLSDEAAEKKLLFNYPNLKPGTVIEKGGKLYKITALEPTKIKRKQYYMAVMAEPVDGGEAEEIWGSQRYIQQK